MANIYWVGTSTDAATGSNYSGGSLPTTGDNLVLIPEFTGNLTSNVYSIASVALGDFAVLAGNSSSVGGFGDYFQIDPDTFNFAGSGQAFIDLQAAAIDVSVSETYQTGAKGKRGLYLKGSALATVMVSGGDVGLGYVHGETTTVTTARVTGGSLYIGDGVTLTTLEVHGGTVEVACNVATLKVYGGTVNLTEDSDVTTLTQYGGLVNSIGKGDITTATINGGQLNMNGSNTRTIATLQVNPGGGISYDINCVTITTQNAPDSPITISTSGK